MIIGVIKLIFCKLRVTPSEVRPDAPQENGRTQPAFLSANPLPCSPVQRNKQRNDQDEQLIDVRQADRTTPSWPINYQTIISRTNKTACKQGIFFKTL